jgi:hypothetical protein
MDHHEQRSLPARGLSLPGDGAAGPWVKIAGGVGAAGLVGSGLLGWLGSATEQFVFSYLVSFLFWLSLALGGLIFVLIQYATRAGWSVVVRRLAENAMGTLPIFALLFLPVAYGVHDLFHWSHWAHGEAAQDPLLAKKGLFLNVGFFYVRAAVYLGIWSFLAWWFRRQSLAQDESKDSGATRQMQSVSAPSIVIFAVTVTFASFDWIMSLDPHWYSTVFGVYFFAGCFLAIHAFLILVCLGLQRRRLLPGVVTFEHYHDMGKMLLAFVVFWAYIAFSQFMLIWYANIPEETVWYARRLVPGWYGVTVALAVGHFVLPFFVLLLRDVKRRRITLGLAALWMLAVHYLDLYWLVMPTLHADAAQLHLLDLLAFIGIGGIFLACFGVLTARAALVPLGDPRLRESLSFENV